MLAPPPPELAVAGLPKNWSTSLPGCAPERVRFVTPHHTIAKLGKVTTRAQPHVQVGHSRDRLPAARHLLGQRSERLRCLCAIPDLQRRLVTNVRLRSVLDKHHDYLWRRHFLGMGIGSVERTRGDRRHRLADGRGIFPRRHFRLIMAAVRFLRLAWGDRPRGHRGSSDSHGGALVPPRARGPPWES